MCDKAALVILGGGGEFGIGFGAVQNVLKMCEHQFNMCDGRAAALTIYK